MKHQEYLSIIEEKTSFLNQDNLLFWDLWCLNYVFEKIDSKKYDFYPELENSFNLLWKYNSATINLENLLDNENIQAIINFDNDVYEELDEFDISDKAVQEFIIGVESIVFNLEEGEEVIYNAYENPINLIDVEIDGIKISQENTDTIYLDEINAQFKLIDDLINNKVNYDFKNRNIYRK